MLFVLLFFLGCTRYYESKVVVCLLLLIIIIIMHCFMWCFCCCTTFLFIQMRVGWAACEAPTRVTIAHRLRFKFSVRTSATGARCGTHHPNNRQNLLYLYRLWLKCTTPGWRQTWVYFELTIFQFDMLGNERDLQQTKDALVEVQLEEQRIENDKFYFQWVKLLFYTERNMSLIWRILIDSLFLKR